MSDITLDLQDTGGRITTVIVDELTLLADVAALARDSLGLPYKDRQGRYINYALFHTVEGRFLHTDLSVQGQDLDPNTLLRILPRAFGDIFELELLSDPNPGMLFPLIGGKECSVGREFGNNIVIRHRAVSRQHGIFTWEDGFHIYTDLESANGSWLNNYPVTEPTPIANGDILNLGQSVTLMYRERVVVRDAAGEAADEVMEHMKTDQSRTGLVQIPKGEIFITYSQGQRHLMEAIAAGLERAGMKVWVDTVDLVETIQRSTAMVAILSREAVTSEALHDMWEEYAAHRKPVVPVIFEPCRVPPLFEHLPMVEYRYNDTQLAGDVLEALYYALR